MKNILEAKELNKVYEIGKNNRKHVLRDISISIIEGDFVSVMGPSGSGKSTLLYNISGMDRATSGSVKMNGKELCNMPEDALADLRLTTMGFVFQQSNLLKNLNILDNILFPAFVAKKEHRRTVAANAKRLMSQLGIAALGENDITQVSGGQLQRVAICRALINNPMVLFGDEPTGALDSKSANEVMDIFTDINNLGTTVVLVTHDAKVAAKTERVLFIADGVIKGECLLGKMNKSENLKSREDQLSAWLKEMGI